VTRKRMNNRYWRDWYSNWHPKLIFFKIWCGGMNWEWHIFFMERVDRRCYFRVCPDGSYRLDYCEYKRREKPKEEG